VSTATRAVPRPDGGVDDAVDVAGRGRTRIAGRVVERIAARAVAEVDRATGVPPKVLGVRLGSAGPDSLARVEADVDGGVVTVRVSMAVQWPAPVPAVTRQVRSHVAERLQRLTGLRVEQVDIDVPVLLAAADEDRTVI
jgi:uncharacterized alkaline shock family protein YloU